MNPRLIVFIAIMLLLCALLGARCRSLHRAEMRLRMNGLSKPCVSGSLTI